MSLSSGEYVQTDVAKSQWMFDLHGSPPYFCTQIASSAQICKSIHPMSTLQVFPGGQAVGPLFGPMTCPHTPALHESIVQLNPSLQSAAVEQPPDPPLPPIPPLFPAPPDPMPPPPPIPLLLLELLDDELELLELFELAVGLPPEPSPPAADAPLPPLVAGVSPPQPTMMPPTRVPIPSTTATKFSMRFISRLRCYLRVEPASNLSAKPFSMAARDKRISSLLGGCRFGPPNTPNCPNRVDSVSRNFACGIS